MYYIAEAFLVGYFLANYEQQVDNNLGCPPSGVDNCRSQPPPAVVLQGYLAPKKTPTPQGP